MLPKTSDYNSEISNNKLGREFDSIIFNLESERSNYYKKTKGLFRRSFFRTALGFSIGFVLIGGYMNDWKNPIAYTIGPIIMSMVLGLIGGGIYTLIRKGTNNYKFSRILKEKLVSKLVSHVNADFRYFDEGIKEEDFDKADLFPNFKDTSLRSEDKITGTINGMKVCFSECMKKGHALATKGKTEIKIKGKVISTEHDHLKTNNGKFVTYFHGLFFELEMDKYNFPSPLKFIPKSKLPRHVETGLNMTGYVQSFVKVDEKEKIDFPGEHDYQIYCKDKFQVLDPKLLKVVDYLFDKYNKKGNVLFGDVPLIGKLPLFNDIRISKCVLISFVEGKMYLALEWPRDMFETDVLLKNNLIESGLAQRVYEEMLFINQLVMEMSLINKAEK